MHQYEDPIQQFEEAAEQCDKIQLFLEEVEREGDRAMRKHAPMNSLHEGYAVLLEEVDELWEQVKLRREDRNSANIRTELIQIAAMATRIAVDLGYAYPLANPSDDVPF